MNLGVHEIYNLLHNNPPDTVAVYVRDNASNVVSSMSILDAVLEVKGLYKAELKAGTSMSVLFARHDQKKMALHEMPKITKRAKHASVALFKFAITSILEGRLPVKTKEEAKRRFALCESNECGYFDGSICRHTQCGCFSKIKTFFETEACPIGEW